MNDSDRLRNLERHYRGERAENHGLRAGLSDTLNVLRDFESHTANHARRKRLQAAMSAGVAALDHTPPTEWEPDPLRQHLSELLGQWRETVSLFKTNPDMREEAMGYLDCIQELTDILAGDLGPIELLRKEPRHEEQA